MKHLEHGRSFSTLLVFLAVLALIMPLSAARAQPSDPNYYLEICNHLCAGESQACSAKPAASEGFCDTNEIECIKGCRSCNGTAVQCVKETDKAGKSCTIPFAACVKDKLAARKPNERPKIIFRGGDGSSQEKAILIEGAAGEFEGIAAESLWAAHHYPAWRKSSQALIGKASRKFDFIEYETPDGSHSLWFDITNFFGKLD